MLNRLYIYYALAVGVAGSAAIWLIGRPVLIIGWWAGMAIGLINFSSLLSNVEKTRRQALGGSKIVTRSLRQGFFVRYLALALAFFLLLKLGREQLGSALVGFLAFYIVTFIDYAFRIRKQGPRPL